MAVYLFTFHTYRSWMPDHRRGFVKRGRGIQPPDPRRAAAYAARARHDRAFLDREACAVALGAIQSACNKPSRNWRMHLGVAVFNHLHALVSWPTFHNVKRVRAVLHHAVNVALRDHVASDHPWLSRGGSLKRIEARPHFEHLVHGYLPSHRKYGGVMLHEDGSLG
jgi:hypothetical protein